MDIEIENGVIRIQKTTWPPESNNQFIDIRRWYMFDSELKATRRGIMIPLDDWDKFVAAISQYVV